MNIYSQERLLELLSTILIQLNALQSQIKSGTDGAARAARAAAIDPATISDSLQTIEQATRDILYLVRNSADDLPLAELNGVTLAEALSLMVEETAEALGLSSRIALAGVDEQGRPQDPDMPLLSAAAERLLYLIAREALYETKLHTGARRLRLTLSYGPDEVLMSIEDDGATRSTQKITDDLLAPPFADETTGAEATAVSLPADSIINDLRYRLEHMGGSLERKTLGERGNRVVACVPYRDQQRVTEEELGAGPVAHVEVQRAGRPLPSTDTISVLVVDGQAVTRAGLYRLLESYPGLRVVGEAADGVHAVSETLELGPQVVLLDAHLPNGQSMEALRQIKQLNLDARILVLATQDREEYLYETLRAGADGYVLKDIAPDELAAAVRAVARGEVLIQPQLAGKLLSRFGKQGRGATRYDTLTVRELEVLRLLARGLRNKEIAARLYVSERTVNFHLANIYQKLNVSGRTEALSKALEQGLITA